MGDQLVNNAAQLLREYLSSRRLRENAAEMENKYKAQLMRLLEEEGEYDDRGSAYFDVEAAGILDPRNDEPVAAIKRERRVSQSMDEEAAEDVLRELGLYDRCTTTVTMLDEDAILSLNFSGEISDEVIKMLYSEKESFAFKVLGA
jgi:hypothetical protein